MSALAYTLTDSTTMLRRNLRRLRRYPSMTLLLVGMPIVFLVLLVYVFGRQLGAELGQAREERLRIRAPAGSGKIAPREERVDRRADRAHRLVSGRHRRPRGPSSQGMCPRGP